ncbi:MAG: decaprenyl-phosphate phosphoribosyltransferase [Sedimentisphaerales bacterium]|nr:decaprenyl-phosphate phosphoribosyltransferase [Sedimentisphaerales bacterium]
MKHDKNKYLLLLAAMRPQQWIKNIFVFPPLLFSGQFFHFAQCLKTMLAFIVFCTVSSSIYIINDLYDRKEDMQHPVKKFRPVASGAVTAKIAIIMAIILTVFGLAIAVLLNRVLFSVSVVIYIIITVFYSMGLKRVVIIDVMIIAAGYVLRVLGGSAAISVIPSHWLVLCTFTISLFLGFTKRRAELMSIAESSESNGVTRIVLSDYSIKFLDQVIPMLTAATIICYALYTVDSRTMEVFGSRAMLITLPSVIFGLFRYIYIIYHLNCGEDPTQTLLDDVPTIINFLIWIILSLIVVLYGEKLVFI